MMLAFLVSYSVMVILELLYYRSASCITILRFLEFLKINKMCEIKLRVITGVNVVFAKCGS